MTVNGHVGGESSEKKSIRGREERKKGGAEDVELESHKMLIKSAFTDPE